MLSYETGHYYNSVQTPPNLLTVSPGLHLHSALLKIQTTDYLKPEILGHQRERVIVTLDILSTNLATQHQSDTVG